MSVLSLPRIHFTGYTDWSPSTGNNADSVYNEATVQPVLQQGVTYATFLDWMKQLDTQMQQPNGSWNVYGDHGARFTQTAITGAQLADGALTAGDPLLGQPVQLQGLIYSDGFAPARLVMTDPFTGGEATSQIFYQWLTVGVVDGPEDQRIGFKAQAACRIFARWPYQTRNLGITFKEGMVGCIWQAAALNKDIQWYGVERSPALAALQAAVTSGSNQGLLMRFASYRTLYYQAASYKGQPITNGLELVAAYQDGYTGDNPARSAMVGTLGIWEQGELASAPMGRFMVPIAAAQIVNSSTTAMPGPAIAKVDNARSVLSLDFISAIPEQNEQLDKANFDVLQLQARDSSGKVTPIASLAYSAYNRQAYESGGGMLEFNLSPEMLAAVTSGTIEITQLQNGAPVVLLQQTQFAAETDNWGVYADEGESVPVSITVTENGGTPTSSVSLLLQQYDSNGNLLTLPVIEILDQSGTVLTTPIVPVTNGQAQIDVRSLQPGTCFLAFYPFVGQPPTNIPKANFPLPASFYAAVRMLPFDNELEQNTPDSQLSWSFVYANVLRVFDLIYPIMSLVRNLADRNVVEAMAEQLKFATSLDTFESTLYMPITRDLSAGKRKLLQRFVNLLPNNVPPDPPIAP